jgi:hypothetical protein
MTSRGARNARKIAQFRLLPLFLALLAAGAECAAGQATEPVVEQPRFTMKISVPKETVEPGAEISVTVELTNTSTERMWFWRAHSGPPPYTIHVWYHAGKPATLTCMGRVFQHEEPCAPEKGKPQRIFSGSGAFSMVEPGETVKDFVSIEDQFDLGWPATYTVRFERIYPGTKLAVKSNTLTLTVTN